MAKYINPPIRGIWPHRDYPAVVRVNGRRFRAAVLQQPYDGVVAQYREDVARDSQHLKVLADGTWRVDHVDEHNPDHGRWLEHFFSDHPLGALAALALCIAGGALVVGAISRG